MRHHSGVAGVEASMGFRRSHECRSCGLRGTVSGGRDCGFYAETQTRYCPHCRTLDDVGVGLWCKDRLADLLPPDRVKELLDAEAEFGLCPSCQRPGGRPWVAGTPCPRCGGALEATDEHFVQWI